MENLAIQTVWLTRTAGTTAAIFGTSAIGGDFNVASDTATECDRQ